MQAATFEKLLQQLRTLEHRPTIILGGFGEPLFQPRILEMVTRLREVAGSLELITNGMLLTEAMMHAFIRLPLDVLWFSADRLHTDASGKPSELLPTMRQLHCAREVLHAQLPQTGLIFVATRTNLAEFPALVQGSVSHGISRFMLTNVLPYSEDMCSQTLYDRTVDYMDSSPSRFAPQVQLPRMDWTEDTRQALYEILRSRPNARLNDASLSMPVSRCPFVEAGAISVAWDGAVSPCLALMHSHSSYILGTRRSVARYAIGNIHNAPLTQLWDDPAHQEFRGRVQRSEFSPCTICGGCTFVEANNEDCFMNAFPTCGGCLWAWGVIQCP